MENPNEVVDPSLQLTEEEQKLVNQKQGIVDDDNIDLPSDETPPQAEGDKLYVGKYKTVEALDEGIKNLGSDLPDTVLAGMTPEAKEEYYKTLQSKQSTKPKDAGLQVEEPAEEEVNPEEEPPAEEEKISVSQLNTELYDSIWDNGGLTEEQYAKYEKMGYSSEDIDALAEAQKQKVQTTNTQILEIVGGEEAGQEALKWAGQNLTQAEKIELNDALKNGKMLTIKGFYQDYLAKTSQEQPQRRPMGETKQSKGEGYKNRDEYLADVRDKRYTQDKYFQAKVEKKLANSSF